MPGSTGAEAGIRYGDVLLAANGVRTKRVEDYFSAKELRDDGVELLIFRDGVELTLFVAYRPFKGPMADFAHMVADGRYVTPRGPEEPNKAPAS
jgi:hypothetical protein